MPAPPIPDEFRDLLQGTFLAHAATVDAKGRPQVNPVWFIWDSKHVMIGVREATAKYRNLRQNPAIAVSILDPTNAYRYIELRGRIIDFHFYDDLSFVNQLAQKYTGADYPSETKGESRYRLTMEVTHWTAH